MCFFEAEWGGRRELVEGNAADEDDKSGEEGLHLEVALGKGGGGGSSSVFPHRCSYLAFGFLDFSFETRDFIIS
ncbi:hypothetical protein MRB53_018126 [Persea americana]|uniref:Uncharacterized protein n=1 Tax=Persea americana TaxID=3435 RepID=A0ACC2M8E7_PERAE|nr:hypothetical protein MRB53_018126 [Persea americana]